MHHVLRFSTPIKCFPKAYSHVSQDITILQVFLSEDILEGCIEKIL